MDIQLLRLQYEILNKSFEQIAAEQETSARLLEIEAVDNGWTQLWPDPPLVKHDEDADASEIMALESEQYIDTSKKRLKVYSLAKEILLAQKYLELESKIIDVASDILDQPEVLGAQGVKQLSALYKDLTAGSNLNNLASMTIGQDESGLPSVIIRDLSGRR